jgi:two-component system, OmpR family, copper resistance phosphate regulon response regulator CusR
MATILLVEDEVNVSSFIKKGLEEENYSVETAFDGTTGLNLALNKEYNLIILDIILPNMNGIEVCAIIRDKIGFNIPIIMLTALGSTEEIVKGLEVGADDYLVKPFHFKELLARVNANLRRQIITDDVKILKFADVVLDLESKLVTRAEKPINLTSKEFRLLIYFLKNPKKVLSRYEILENVWDINFDMGTNLVDVYVNYLRNKIEKDFPTKLIHTVIGMGYIFKEE